MDRVRTASRKKEGVQWEPPKSRGQHEGLQFTISSAKLKLYVEGYEEDPSMRMKKESVLDQLGSLSAAN